MVGLVFRRYTQIQRSICTSESLRASTSVSAGFTLFRHSSLSFGSQQIRSYSNLSESRIGRSMMLQEHRTRFSRQPSMTIFASIALTGFHHPETRAHIRLLGPCFKTERMEPYVLQLVLFKRFKIVLIPITRLQNSPVLLFFVTTSPCQDWVIFAPAATFLGCGSRFSGSLSRIEP